MPRSPSPAPRRAPPLALAAALAGLLACAPSSKGGSESTPGYSETGLPETALPITETASGEETATELESVPGSVQEPGEALFRDDLVHELSLELDDEAWDSLLVDPKTYVEGTLSDGETSLSVGVRLKGWSSFQPLTGKPSIRVSFDHYVEGQRYDELEAVDLVSEVEDPAFVSEAIAYRIFRDAGQPASRTGFAWLRINDQDYGLYTLVEKKDDVLVKRWWPDDDDGSLYESSSIAWPCDLDDGGSPRCDCWEQDEVGSADERADLEALCALATDTADADWRETIEGAVDWDEISGHMATEILIDAYDHYAGYMGNVYLYHQADAGRWSLLPASMNSAFGSTRYSPGSCGSSGRVPEDFDGGLLIRRCWDDETCKAELYEALGDAVRSLQGSDILEQIDAWGALVEPYVAVEPKAGWSVEQFQTHLACVRDWLEDRPAELQVYLPVECLGEGGDLDVSGWGDLSTNGSCDRDEPDIVAFPVVALDGARVELAEDAAGLEAGDEALLLVLQGSAGEHEAVGAYALAEVAAVDGDVVTLAEAPDLGLGADLSAWKLVLQRVPVYGDVAIRSGGTLTAGAWDGQRGGVLALRVTGTLTIEDGGVLSAAGLGYAGGAMGESYNIDGYQGESLEGTGIGGASSAEGYNEANGAWAANLGGGGCNIGGAGGEHAGGATDGVSWNGTATAPLAGETYGEESLAALYLGSGGGGVVNLSGASGPGGAGGGVLLLEAGTVIAEGEGAILASGEDGTAWASGSWTYGAGDGAGGSLWLQAEELILVEGAILATGGYGEDGVDRPGGDGGEGRIRVDCGTVNGAACSEAALEGLSSPAAYVVGR